MEFNPNASPLTVEPIAGRQRVASPSVAWSLFWAFALAFVCGGVMLVAGYYIGRMCYDLDSAGWNHAIYPSGAFGADASKKVREQTGIRFALNCGALGFLSGGFTPLLSHLWLTRRNRKRVLA